MNKKILVTGADGFIGSHLVEELVRQGYKVRAFVLYNSFNSWGWLDYTEPEILKEIEIFSGDIRDPHGVKKAMKDCNTVFHLAALIAIPYSYHSPDTYIDTNIKGTLNILEAARELEIEKIIHTSTSEVYGTAKFIPITEDHPLQGQSPYAASKIGADQLAMSYYYSFDTPVTIIRPFNTYGPRQSARAVIPTIISQIITNKKSIKIGNLDTTRNFNFISDTVNGFIKIFKSGQSIGEVINIGSDFEISIGDTLKLISEITNTNIEIMIENERKRPEKSEVMRLCASNEKAKKIANWYPLFKGIEGFKKGLKETISWFLKPEILNKYKSDRYNL